MLLLIELKSIRAIFGFLNSWYNMVECTRISYTGSVLNTGNVVKEDCLTTIFSEAANPGKDEFLFVTMWVLLACATTYSIFIT